MNKAVAEIPGKAGKETANIGTGAIAQKAPLIQLQQKCSLDPAICSHLHVSSAGVREGHNI